jgi:hypothetical protein
LAEPTGGNRELEPLLQQNPQSIDAIQKPIEIASRHFSGDRLSVTIIKDPEHDNLNQLSVIVKTSLKAEDRRSLQILASRLKHQLRQLAKSEFQFRHCADRGRAWRQPPVRCHDN